MLSKSQHRNVLRGAGLLLVFIAAAYQAERSQGQGAADAPDPGPVDEASVANDAESPPAERAEEAPIDVGANARPTLDYEPSETISEDSSVSFPVDI